MADALIGIGIDLSEVVKAAGQLAATVEGDTEKALREIQRQAIKSAKNIEKAIKAQAREQKKAAKDAERAARRAAAAAEKQAQEAREAAKGLVELAGIGADRFDKLRAVFAGLSSPIGQVAVAATAGALAVAGLAAAFVGAGAAAVRLVRVGGDLVDELEPMRKVLKIDAAAVASIEAANVALDGAAAAGKALVVQLAEKLAPAVERTAVLVVKMGLAAGDALDSMGGGAQVLANVFVRMGRVLVGAIAAPISSILDLADMLQTVARLTGFDDLANSLDSVNRKLADLTLETVELGFQGAEHATRDYDQAAKDLLGVIVEQKKKQDKRNTSTKQGTEADKAAAEAARQAAKAFTSYERALSAARAPFVDKSEIAVLRRLQAALVESASAAALTTGQARELSQALSQVAGRIEQIQAAQAGAFDPLTSELDAAGADAVSSLDAMSADVAGSMEGIQWGAIYADGLLSATTDAAGKAVDIFTGLASGSLAAVMGPAAGPIVALLEQIGGSGGPKAAKGMARSMANAAIDFVTNLASNIGPFVAAIVKKIPDILTAIAKAIPVIFVEIMKAGPQLGLAIVKGLVQAIPAFIRSMVRQIKKAVREAVQIGQRVRRRFSDTPGPVRVNRETAVSVAPGDYVVAARAMQGIRAQAGGSSSSGSMEATMVIDFRDGPARIGVERATARAVDRRGYGRNTTGRRRVY